MPADQVAASGTSPYSKILFWAENGYVQRGRGGESTSFPTLWCSERKPKLLAMESVSYDDWLAQRHERVCRWPALVRPAHLGRIRTSEKSRSNFGFGRMPKEIRMVVRWPR